MSFLAPWMMVAGVVAAFGVIALHLLTTRRPPAVMLPTARFVPESDVRAVARASRPTDLLLLALRALAVLAIGAAFAQPVPDAPGAQVRTVVALEWTTAIDDIEAARAKAKSYLSRGNALVVFDTAAHELPLEALDTLSVPSPLLRRASLSPMFVRAHDAGMRIARGADSVRLVVISGVSADGLDAATPAWRASWPGRVEVIALAVQSDTATAPRLDVSGLLPDDPLQPALATLRAGRGAHGVRLARAEASAADSAWVREVPGAVLVLWPATAASADVARDGSVDARADTIIAAGVVALDGGDAIPLVAPLMRRSVPEGRVVARWRDGLPAVTERRYGNGCVRSVGVGIPAAGDLTLRPPFAHFLAAMLAPCGGARGAVLPDSALPWLRAEGALADGPMLAAAASSSSPLTKWLLLLATLLLAIEQVVRRIHLRKDA
jgi:hypothetical protein